MSGSDATMLRGVPNSIPPDKHPVQLLGVNLLEDIFRRHSSISCSVPPMAAAGVVQRGLMDAREAVRDLAVGACSGAMVSRVQDIVRYAPQGPACQQSRPPPIFPSAALLCECSSQTLQPWLQDGMTVSALLSTTTDLT